MSLKEKQICFFGVRGSCATGGAATKSYGGNTPCIGIDFHKNNIIMDAGTGIQKASRYYDADMPINLFLTHLHWDHISGLLFFKLMYNSKAVINIYGPKQSDKALEDCIKTLFQKPYFPVEWNELRATINTYELTDRGEVKLNGGTTIKTYNTLHTDLCLAYRLEDENCSICYVTDIEYEAVSDKDSLINFVSGSDILIMDSTYTPEEYNGDVGVVSKKGWGHSTWEDAASLALEGRVKKLYLFHHSIDRTDRELDEILEKCRKVFKESYLACEDI